MKDIKSTIEVLRDVASHELKASEDSLKHEELSQITKRTKEVRDALLEAFEGITHVKMGFKESSAEYLKDLRDTRMSVVNEISLILKSFEDIRKFFLSPIHSEEISRIKEFVELCERLQSLKQSGFIDAISDTILKLDSK